MVMRIVRGRRCHMVCVVTTCVVSDACDLAAPQFCGVWRAVASAVPRAGKPQMMQSSVWSLRHSHRVPHILARERTQWAPIVKQSGFSLDE
jgi:hypothetical protein